MHGCVPGAGDVGRDSTRAGAAGSGAPLGLHHLPAHRPPQRALDSLSPRPGGGQAGLPRQHAGCVDVFAFCARFFFWGGCVRVVSLSQFAA
eukprot:1865501-Rhodomonas_salina.4